MTTFQMTAKQFNRIDENLSRVKLVLEGAPTQNESAVCLAYIDLCQSIAEGVVADGTMIMVGREDFAKDNLDRVDHHSISGNMNNPSVMQEEAFKKEHENG